MLDGYMGNLAYRISRDYDMLIESCFAFLGFDKNYVIQHEEEFGVDIYPDGRRTFHRNGNPLFTVFQKFDNDFENHKVVVVFEVSWHSTIGGEKENG